MHFLNHLYCGAEVWVLNKPGQLVVPRIVDCPERSVAIRAGLQSLLSMKYMPTADQSIDQSNVHSNDMYPDIRHL